MKYREIGLLSAGHLCTDMTQAALPAMLPFLLTARHLNYALAGALVFASTITSSIVQPIFGHFADRLSKPWLMPAGLLLTGLGMSLAGVAPTFWSIALVVAVCGIGVAAFHPEAARLANSASGERKASGMSIFSVGGNAGFAFGPLLTIAVVAVCGLRGTLLFAVPCTVMALTLLLQHRRFSALAPAAAAQQAGVPVRDEFGAFTWLAVAVTVRSIMFYGIFTFLALYWTRVLHQSETAGGAVLTLFSGVGAIATFFGGRLADRWGYRQIMRAGFVLFIPLLYGWTFALCHLVSC